MTNETRTFEVTADHVAPQYAAARELVRLSWDSGYVAAPAGSQPEQPRGGWFATNGKRGCGRTLATPEAAIRSLYSNDGCTNIRAVEVAHIVSGRNEDGVCYISAITAADMTFATCDHRGAALRFGDERLAENALRDVEEIGFSGSLKIIPVPLATLEAEAAEMAAALEAEAAEMAPAPPTFEPGSRVVVTDYGVEKAAEVTRVGRGVTFVRMDQTGRERWFHTSSLRPETASELRQCGFCPEAFTPADSDEGETWQQWQCPACGSWNDKPPADPDAAEDDDGAPLEFDDGQEPAAPAVVLQLIGPGGGASYLHADPDKPGCYLLTDHDGNIGDGFAGDLANVRAHLEWSGYRVFELQPTMQDAAKVDDAYLARFPADHRDTAERAYQDGFSDGANAEPPAEPLESIVREMLEYERHQFDAVCSVCDGSGHAPEFPHEECDNCGGTGDVSDHDLSVSGADLVDAFAAWRPRLKAAIAR